MKKIKIAVLYGGISAEHDVSLISGKAVIDNLDKDVFDVIPAKLSKDKKKEIKSLAQKAYRSLDCRGFARVDLFLEKNGKIYLNEINTIPGFTEFSMFPKLMKNSGLSFKDLLTKIIELGLK